MKHQFYVKHGQHGWTIDVGSMIHWYCHCYLHIESVKVPSSKHQISINVNNHRYGVFQILSSERTEKWNYRSWQPKKSWQPWLWSWMLPWNPSFPKIMKFLDRLWLRSLSLMKIETRSQNHPCQVSSMSLWRESSANHQWSTDFSDYSSL